MNRRGFLKALGSAIALAIPAKRWRPDSGLHPIPQKAGLVSTSLKVTAHSALEVTSLVKALERATRTLYREVRVYFAALGVSTQTAPGVVILVPSGSWITLPGCSTAVVPGKTPPRRRPFLPQFLHLSI